MAISQPVICPDFIGRAGQVALFHKLTAEIANGSSSIFRVVMIRGEAGIGKSRFVQEVTSSTHQEESIILRGRCSEQDHAQPYGLIIDLLNTFCLEHTQEQIDDFLQPFASILARIFPEISIYCREISPSPRLDPEQQKQRIFQAVAQFLLQVESSAPHSRPLVLALDDLHWCDGPSLEFLQYLTRHKLPRTLLLVGTYRSDERYEAMELLVAEWNRLRMLTEIELSPLSLGETDHMLRSLLAAENPIHYDLLDAIYRLTEGNPFFLEEAYKGIVESGGWEHISSNDLPVPRTVQLAVQHRLDHLDTGSRNLVFTAAVIGRRFQRELLQKLLDQPASEFIRQMLELRDAQMVIEESPDHFAFRHALTREAIYLSILGMERKRLHRLIAETLEQDRAGSSESLLNDLSYHFFEAGEWKKAGEYAQKAGEYSQSLEDTRSALLHFTRAVDAARQLGDSPATAIWRARAQAHQTLGHFEAARIDYESLLKIAEQSQHHHDIWRSLLDLGFLWTGRDYQQAGTYFEKALDSARELNEPSLLGQTLNRVGNWRYMAGEPGRAVELHQEALQLIEATNNIGETASTLDLLGISHYGFGDLWRGREYYERAIQLYRTLGERQGLIASLCAYPISGGSYITMTAVPAPVDMQKLIRNGDEAVQIATQMAWHPNQAYAFSFQAIALGPHGEFQKAWDAAQRSLSIATEIEHDFFVITAHYTLGALYLDLLDPAQARDHLQKALSLGKESGAEFISSNVRGYLAQAHLLLEEVDLAEDIVREESSDELSMQSESLRRLCVARVELMLKKGLGEDAVVLVKRLVDSTPHANEGVVSPLLWFLHGRAMRARGRDLEAESLLRESLQAAVAFHLWPLVWQVQIELGQVLKVMRRLTEAAEQWSAARQTIQQLADKIAEPIIRDTFMESALRLIPNPSEREQGKIDYGGLTVREREIVSLIAGGSSNNQIAESLVLSRRTVEAHVANIMSKLGLRTRAQIAAWAVEKGLKGSEGR